MKSIFYIALVWIIFTASAYAQEEQDNIRRQPPAITHKKVVMDERLAEKERKKHTERQHEKTDKINRKEKESTTSVNNTLTGKTSSKP
jgi:hypothetical protein